MECLEGLVKHAGKEMNEIIRSELFSSPKGIELHVSKKHSNYINQIHVTGLFLSHLKTYFSGGIERNQLHKMG